MKMTLKVAWSKRDKLYAKSAKLWAKCDKLRAESAKLWAEGDKLRAEGAKLRAEGDKLWAETVISIVGNVTLDWVWRSDEGAYACIVDGKQTFEPITKK